MQDRSHKLVFLGLTALMSAAAFYGSEIGPTLLITNDGFPPASLNQIDPVQGPICGQARDGWGLFESRDRCLPTLSRDIESQSLKSLKSLALAPY